MLANVKIEQDKKCMGTYRVYQDGNELKRIKEVNFNISTDSFPEVDITIGGGCDFEGMADIHFDYSPRTVKEAFKILREELFKHGDLYDGFASSILSVLKENSRYIGDGETEIIAEYGENQLAEEILKQIIGED